MAKLLNLSLFCLLVGAATACHPRPSTPRPPPTRTTPTGGSPKLTSTTRRPTTTTTLTPFEAEVKEKLREWDEDSEIIRKAFEIGEGVTEMIEGVAKEIPLVKFLGGLFSIFATIFDNTAKILQELWDEMEKQFAEINSRLDMIEWKLDDIMHEIAEKFEMAELKNQFDQITKIQAAKIDYQKNTDKSTLDALRHTCATSDPPGVIAVLHKTILDSVDAMFNDVEYGLAKWEKWSSEIAKHFVQAMLMEQVCLGVKINDDKSRPTPKDIEFYANSSTAKFVEMTNAMKAKEDIMNRDWYEKQLQIDVNKTLVENRHASDQDKANAILAFLKNKYGFYFGVTILNELDKWTWTTNRIINNSKVKILQTNGLIVVVHWTPKAHLRKNNQKMRIENIGINCNTDLSGFQNIFLNMVASDYGNQFQSDFDFVYLFTRSCGEIAFPKKSHDCGTSGNINGAYDDQVAVFLRNEHCRYIKKVFREQCVQGYCGHGYLDTPFDFGYYAVLGF
jgi:hypothetical protein